MLRPTRLESVLRSKGSYLSERPAYRGEEWPPLAAAGEGSCTAVETQCSQK